MKRLLSLLLITPAFGEGFSDADLIFYGEVRQVGGGGTVLLQAGELNMTFVHPSDPANVVTLEVDLKPTGAGETKPFSYAIKVPLRFLPDTEQKTKSFSVSSAPAAFQLQNITIDGRPATMPDGSLEFFPISFADRGSQHRLDLIIDGESTDSDGDLLPDWWETLYGVTDPTADPDSDGWNNAREFALGSNPNVSNRETSVVTTEVLIPESGQAGLFLQFLDSDTPLADIPIELSVTGFELQGPTSVTATDFSNGSLVIAHQDAAEGQLSLTWAEGTTNITLTAVHPAPSEASLWLDGHQLPADGEAVSAWPDRSGHDRSAMQPTEESRPLVSGRSVDFSNGGYLFFQDPALPNGNHTILAAYQTSSSSAAQTLFSSNRGHFKLASSTQAISYPGAPLYQMDGLAVRGFESTNGTSIFRREGGLLQSIYNRSYDGEVTTAGTLEPVLPTLGVTRPAIGAVKEAFQGQLQELLIFPAALPEQLLRDVSDYLDSKWNDSVVWDLSTELRGLTLTGSDQANIIRGGLGSDRLTGGPLDDIISGGPGSDVLTGGSGSDQFVFGQVDIGNDRITDFTDEDILDLSALFWGQTGDARDHITTRLETNFSGDVPSLDTVIIVDGSLEITLENLVISADQLVQMIVESRLRVGALSIPTTLALSSESAATIREHLGESFQLELTRSGDGVAAALDVPIGFFGDALGLDFHVEGKEGQRALVSFARGETSKTITVRAVPDLEDEGLEEWEAGVLPQYKYTVSTSPVTQLVTDIDADAEEFVEEVADHSIFNAWLADHSDYESLDQIPVEEKPDLIQQYVQSNGLKVSFQLKGDRPEFTLSGQSPPEILWEVAGSEGLKEWQAEVFQKTEAAGATTFTGDPIDQSRRFYKITPEIFRSLPLITNLVTGAQPVAVGGTGSWRSIPGAITTNGPGRLILEIEGDTELDFAVEGLAFSIDGEPITEVDGRVKRTLSGHHLLIWESNGSGSISE